jgi:hypothetical protein
MANDKEILAVGALAEELLEVFESSFGRERGGVQNLGFVAGLGADERSGLEAALERAGDDEIELDVQCIQHVSELETVLFALFVEGAFLVEKGISTTKSGAGVAEDENIHNLLIV